MKKNLILFCNICGEMKKITYKYIKDDLNIICECLKDHKKENHSIELFLNNDYKSKQKLKCREHNASFSFWCKNCNMNICGKCLNNHNNHKMLKISSLIVSSSDINVLEYKVNEFEIKLQKKKKIVEEKKIFNQNEEKEFFINFQKYYNLNINEIKFVRFIKEQYQYLLKNNLLCYQIIINLKYLLQKLDFFLVKNVYSSTLKKESQKDKELNDFIDIYNMIFQVEHYCLLPKNDNEDIEKKAEEMQNTFRLERSQVFNEENKSQFLSELQSEKFDSMIINEIPLTETINLDETNKSKSFNNNTFNAFTNFEQNFRYDNNNNNNINNDNKVASNEKTLGDSDSLISSDSNFFLLKSNVKTKTKTSSNKSSQKLQYFGSYKNGKYHCDLGKLIYPNGFIYEGSFREGLRHGEGTLSNPQKSYIYNGGWFNDNKHGKCLEIINGETFEGFYKNGVRDGQCTIIYNNKDKFVGHLKDGKKEGYGEQFYFNTGSTYKGFFRNNLFEGKGKIMNDNGYIFEGEFLGGLRHGDNCKEMKYGVRKYEGQFRRDKMNGKGIYEWYEGESKGDIYNGEFKEDLFDGLGTYKYSDGTIYIGEFSKGVKSGKGKTIYSDGSFHEGEYRNNTQSGQGIFQDLEGNIYEGNFSNGNKHSKGKIKFTNGETLEGLWLNGMKEGNFIFIDSKGNKYYRKYSKDELVKEEKEGFFTSVFNVIYDKIGNFIN